MRALVFHQLGLGSNHGVNGIMWAGFVVANLSFTLRDFSLATLFPPLFKNHHFHVVPNSNLTSWNSRQRTWLCGYATSEKIIIDYV